MKQDNEFLDALRPSLDDVIAACEVEPDERQAFIEAAAAFVDIYRRELEARDLDLPLLPELASADLELQDTRLVVRRRADDSIYSRRGPLYVLDPDDQGVLRFTVEDGEQRIELLTENGQRHPVVDAERVEAASR